MQRGNSASKRSAREANPSRNVNPLKVLVSSTGPEDRNGLWPYGIVLGLGLGGN